MTRHSASLSLSAFWLQVDPDVFAALPKELQEELKSAYNRLTNVQPQTKMSLGELVVKECNLLFFFSIISKFSLSCVFPLGFLTVEQKNPLLQLKQSGIGIGRVKRRYKRKNAVSPVKKGPSPLKRRHTTNSPAKTLPSPLKSRELINIAKVSQ